MLLNLWRRWVANNERAARRWTAEQVGDKVFTMPIGPCKGQDLDEMSLQELKAARFQLDPRDNKELYDAIQSAIQVKEYFFGGGIRVHTSDGGVRKDVFIRPE